MQRNFQGYSTRGGADIYAFGMSSISQAEGFYWQNHKDLPDYYRALDAGKLRRLGWAPQVPFERGIDETVRWYVEHEAWWRPIKDHDGEFRRYYREQYGARLG